MLADLDGEMERRGVDAIIALGDSTSGNPDLLYLVGLHLPRGGIYVKRRGQKPMLVVSETDRGRALSSRIEFVKTYGELGYYRLLAEDAKNGYTNLVLRALGESGVEGGVALYGRHRANVILQLSSALERRGFTVLREHSPTLLESVMMTKSDEEIDAIRGVGEASRTVVRRVLEYLASCRRVEGHVVDDGDYLTVGHVKRLIRRLLAEYNLNPIEGLIFAPAPGSCDPHYSGLDSEAIKVGQPIVFDVFPQGAGGYWFDLTRTFSLGAPSSEFKAMYEAVLEAQIAALDSLRSGVSAREAMKLACSIFEKLGYETPRTNPSLKSGFIHGLGHGVGLTIGERPYLSLYSDDVLGDRQVFTVEPGLYDPRYGGVRIEDVVVMQSGVAKNLTDLEKVLFY